MVVNAGPRPSSMRWLVQGFTNGWEVDSSHYVPRGTTVEDGESTTGVDFSNRTPQQRTFKLPTSIGHRPMCVLVDSGSTGNYIDARECAARGIKIEAEDQVEEFKRADATMVNTEGRVLFTMKCGGYRGQISARFSVI